MDFDTIILGAGAAGLMCACQSPGRTLVVDHAKAAGEKIRISGGGRCNFTNMYAGPENFISRNPHFMKSALSRYTQWDFIDWVARTGIAYHEKTLGQLFCDQSAKDIVAMLVAGVADAGGQIALSTKIENVEAMQGGFQITLSGAKNATVTTRNLVVATGGKPIPKMGATDFALRLARQFDLPVTQTVAGLVPFTFTDTGLDMCKSLAGVAAPARMTTPTKSFEEAVLFTHRGLSGPASLQCSSYWSPGDAVHLALASDPMALIEAARRASPRRAPKAALEDHLPARLIDAVLADLPLGDRLADMTAKQMDAFATRLSDWQLWPNGTEGYRTAEVMVGGVDTDALSSKTMEAKAHPGLFFIGECVDVTGWLGGFNFQWAWSSGWVAGQTIQARHAI